MKKLYTSQIGFRGFIWMRESGDWILKHRWTEQKRLRLKPCCELHLLEALSQIENDLYFQMGLQNRLPKPSKSDIITISTKIAQQLELPL